MLKFDERVSNWLDDEETSEAVFEEFETTMQILADELGLTYLPDYSTQSIWGSYFMTMEKDGVECSVEYDYTEHCNTLIKHGGKATAEWYFKEFMDTDNRKKLGV